MMKKDLDYYLGLSYKIEVIPIPPEDGGGYEANLPEVGRLAIVGDGETPAEAIADLERIKAEQFRHYLEKGIDIPEPGAESEETFGRQFVIRFPAALHKEIILQSKENGISPDEFVLRSLSSMLGQRYIKLLKESHGCRIEIINESANDRDELMQDFVSLVTCFTARLYGLRRSKRKTEKLIRELENENNKVVKDIAEIHNREKT